MSSDNRENQAPDAESAFAEFLRRREAGDEIDFEDFCAERPKSADALRILFSMHQGNTGSSDSGDAIGERDTASVAGDLSIVTPETERPGSSIGPYRILETLGEGGFGTVFLAQQESPVRRRVALKILKLGMDTREIVVRFDAEKQALAVMNHPNVAKVLDAGSTDRGRPFFVMEHVPGVSITTYCDEHRLSVRERLDLFIQICDAVQHAHQKGIIHRDLKPSNVLVAEQDGRSVPKVIDFGIAKALDQGLSEESILTEHGVLMGTPEYMSPEQADNSAEDIDTRTDIYALGVLLYELLVGALPFESKTLRRGGLAEIQRIIREEEPVKPSTKLTASGDAGVEKARQRGLEPSVLARQIRGDLDWITMKALEKDRTRRYASASEFAADIRHFLQHEPVLAGPPSASYRLRKLARKYRGRIIATGVAIVLVGIVGIATAIVSEGRFFQEKIEQSREARTRGEEFRDRWIEARQRAEARRDEWRGITETELKPWQPIWERRAEIDAYDRYLKTEAEVDSWYTKTVLSLNAAVELAPDNTREKDLGRNAFDALTGDANERGSTVTSIRVETTPVVADIHVFRYRDYEKRLLPVPLNAGPEWTPYLEIEHVDKGAASPFELGDRWMSVGGQPVSLRGDLARAVSTVKPSESVDVEVLRSGQRVRVEWVPFESESDSRYEPGRVVSIPIQFGFRFAGYPLDIGTRSLVARSLRGAPVAVELPPGSYLFVLRAEGFVDVRWPVVAPGESRDVQRVELLEEEEIPRGFVRVPSGPFSCGGDTVAFQSLERSTVELDEVFISRYELTVGEYLEFVNDPEVFAATDDKGYVAPRSREVIDQLAEFKDERVRLVPFYQFESRLYWRKNKGAKRWETSWPHSQPVLAVSHFAAMEYAAWRSRRDRRFRYRLPTDLEWEKAARGVDRRTYVWGNYMVWSFTWNGEMNELVGKKKPVAIGFCPLDESVYGVRDMGGSVSEMTLGRPKKGEPHRSHRGGTWNVTDEYYFRIPNRNGLYPVGLRNDTGFRLVAERRLE